MKIDKMIQWFVMEKPNAESIEEHMKKHCFEVYDVEVEVEVVIHEANSLHYDIAPHTHMIEARCIEIE